MNKLWENAIRDGDVDALRLLIAGGADIDARDRHAQTGLMIAARDEKVDVVCVLIDAGADLNHRAKFGLTALMLAVINRHRRIVTLLVDAGADKEVRGSGAPGFADKTALDIATAQGDVE